MCSAGYMDSVPTPETQIAIMKGYFYYRDFIPILVKLDIFIHPCSVAAHQRKTQPLCDIAGHEMCLSSRTFLH